MSDSEILTEKQCAVLDLLIDHKTSKEIARELGISPHTVDQRISLSRVKLGVSSRNELAARYRAMRETPTQGASANNVGQPRRQNDDSDASNVSDREKMFCPTPGSFDYRVGPKVFDGGSGGLWRIGAIVAIALLTVTAMLVLFAVFGQINDMLHNFFPS